MSFMDVVGGASSSLVGCLGRLDFVRSNMDSSPNSDGELREAEGLNLVGMIGGSSIFCPPGGAVLLCVTDIKKPGW